MSVVQAHAHANSIRFTALARMPHTTIIHCEMLPKKVSSLRPLEVALAGSTELATSRFNRPFVRRFPVPFTYILPKVGKCMNGVALHGIAPFVSVIRHRAHFQSRCFA